MFKVENFYKFEDFVGYTVEDLEALKRTQNNITKVFNKRKVTLIYNMIRYYKFLQSDDTTKKQTKDPENWDKDDFDDWVDDRRHPTLASAKAAKANPTLTGTTTTPNTTVSPATVCSHTKKVENAWLSWQRSRRDIDKYPKISNDREYSDWIIKMERQFEEDRCL